MYCAQIALPCPSTYGMASSWQTDTNISGRSAQANQGTFIISPGTAIYWTYASCQVYMNNELSPAQDIVYCYDWNNCGSSTLAPFLEYADGWA